ncbi:MAG: phosphodiesterase [Paracoccaceae bacterium]|nr:phosphodiesterase [Paracoccaceae bacterium]
MTKLIWMSDLHFTAEGDVLGHDPRARLEAAISHINAHHDDAAYCVISGDLVNRGTPGDYATLAQALDGLTIPYLPMAGNHDDRALVRAHLPIPNDTMAAFVQYAVAAEGAAILCLDTLDPGKDSGAFCEDRKGWLRAALSAAGDTPAVIFMHHPPLPLCLPMQDADRLRDGEAFLQLLQGFDNVTYLCCGHVHRPITGTTHGIPFATMRSVLYQAPPPQPAWDWESFAPAKEAPALGVLKIGPSGVTLQYDQFCAFEIGT